MKNRLASMIVFAILLMNMLALAWKPSVASGEPVHDVAVIGITLHSTSVIVGNSVFIDVTVMNRGDFAETFGVYAYFDSTLINLLIVSLGSGQALTLRFTWNTTGVALGNYRISAVAGAVLGEVDLANNSMVNGFVEIHACVGDIFFDSSSLAGIGHVGIYVGNGEVVEAQKRGGVNRSRVETWDHPYRENVYVLRVRCSDEIKWEAAAFAEAQVNKSYDIRWWQKNSNPNSTSWYCSELVWAAYYNQGIDIEYTPDSWVVTPREIFLDEDTFIVGCHIEDEKAKEGIGFLAKSPVDLAVTDPDALTVSKELDQILGAVYVEDDLTENGSPDDFVAIPERKIGDYLIMVIPEPDAAPTDTYTLEASADYETVVLAENAYIHDVPTQPYVLKSTETGIIRIIHATVDLNPDTLNLKSNGEWITCYIELSTGYSIGNIDINTISLNGTIEVDLTPMQIGDYDDDDIDDLMVKFDRVTVVEWLGTVDCGEDAGKRVEVALVITGEVGGTPFEGIDTVEMLLKG